MCIGLCVDCSPPRRSRRSESFMVSIGCGDCGVHLQSISIVSLRPTFLTGGLQHRSIKGVRTRRRLQAKIRVDGRTGATKNGNETALGLHAERISSPCHHHVGRKGCRMFELVVLSVFPLVSAELLSAGAPILVTPPFEGGLVDSSRTTRGLIFPMVGVSVRCAICSFCRRI